MQRIAMFIFLLMFAVPAMSATAVMRQSEFIDQYKISDPGGDYDNHLIFISFGLTEVVIQTSSVDFNTQKESLLCWNEDVPECPDDDIGGGVFRMPALTLLAEIQISGGITVGADLSDIAMKSIFLAFWHEYRTEKLVEDSITEMALEGLNDLQQRRALKYIYFGNGIDIDTAQSIANNRITNSVQATYNDYGLATMPLQDRRLLKLFGVVGWFE